MKDYAKSPKTENSHSNQKSYIIFISICLALLVSLWASVALIHKRHLQKKHSIENKIVATPNKKITKQTSIINKKSIAQPGFDFYHLLPSIKVPPPANNKIEEKPALQKTYLYILQVATSNNKRYATELQKRLTAMNIDSYLLPIYSNNNATRYRIMSGPYEDVVRAQKLQNQLRLKNIDALLLKRTKNTEQTITQSKEQ